MKNKLLKTHFTRKNLISLALLFLYLVLVLICAIACDRSGIMVKDNPIQAMVPAFGFPYVNGGTASYVLIIVFVIYSFFTPAAVLYEFRLAKFFEEKILSRKWQIIIWSTIGGGLGLCLLIGCLAQYPYDLETMGNAFAFLGQSYVVAFVIYVFLFALIGAPLMIYINMKNIDKPFRFFSNEADIAMEEKLQEEEEEKAEEQDNLAHSFGEETPYENALASGIGAGIGARVGGVGSGQLEEEKVSDKEKVFPGLCTIDYIMENRETVDEFDDNLALKDLCENFRNYLAKEEKIYFDIDTIRAFISGLAASRLIILEGLSGTGKSSLARYFSEYISEKSFFEPVQATWRDRTSILGYFNDFSRSYNETEFLKKLYEATFLPRHVNIMVLDELNISRIEYYFADFLSIMEYPEDEWKLKIMQLPYDFEAPMHLENGILNISNTTWFIGTANKDDSTYTITDKVYDRAITIAFDDRNEPFEVEGDCNKIHLSFDGLQAMFKEAKAKEENRLSKDDYDKFRKLTSFTYDTFDLTFGNRIMHQIEELVPVYVECGGKKEDALDFMFSRKVVAKLEGRFEDYIKQGLSELDRIIIDTYGKDSFKNTRHVISKLLRKL